MKYDLIAIVGPTASGKTSLATSLAARLGNAEIISADSRQLYRGMDLGTGKDLADYCVEGKTIPYHLIDIADAGEKYNLFQYQDAFKNIAKPGGTPFPVVRSGTMQIRKRILDFLFGQQVNVLVLSPGDSVQTVEIHELKGGENHDKRKQI